MASPTAAAPGTELSPESGEGMAQEMAQGKELSVPQFPHLGAWSKTQGPLTDPEWD